MLTTARCETVLDRIGNTPLVRLRRLTRECDFDVYIKLEYLNPSGSLKDRIALRMIEQAERKGLIEPGKSTIVEATTGNTGVAMSMVAAVKGYKLILFAPDETSEHERLAIMKAYGAEVRLIDVSQTSKEFPFLPKGHPERTKRSRRICRIHSPKTLQTDGGGAEERVVGQAIQFSG